MAYNIKPIEELDFESCLVRAGYGTRIENLDRQSFLFAAWKTLKKKTTHSDFFFALQLDDGLIKAKIHRFLSKDLSTTLDIKEARRNLLLMMKETDDWSDSFSKTPTVDPENPQPTNVFNTLVDFGFGSRGQRGMVVLTRYGYLGQFLARGFDTNQFAGICSGLVDRKLPQMKGVTIEIYPNEPDVVTGIADKNIKETSDVEGVSLINDAIQKIMDDVQGMDESPGGGYIGDGITIQIGNKTYNNIVGCVPVTEGEPKADMVLVRKPPKSNTLEPVCFISYKQGAGANAFSQWGGVTAASDESTYQAEETVDMYRDIVTYCGEGIRGANRKKTLQLSDEKTFIPAEYTGGVWRKIKDRNIRMTAIYGNDFAGQSGVQSCDHIVQGITGVNNKTLTAHKIWNKGYEPTEDDPYYPVFGCSYRPGRNSTSYGNAYQIVAARLAIYPRGYRGSWAGESKPWYDTDPPNGEFTDPEADSRLSSAPI